jgi:hypothetical protein
MKHVQNGRETCCCAEPCGHAEPNRQFNTVLVAQSHILGAFQKKSCHRRMRINLEQPDLVFLLAI